MPRTSIRLLQGPVSLNRCKTTHATGVFGACRAEDAVRFDSLQWCMTMSDQEIPSFVSGAAVDTIAAISTPPGRGGIGIVRLSGPQAAPIAAQLVSLRQPLEHSRARLADVLDEHDAGGGQIDNAVVTFFAAPNSYTAEDLVEIAAHGSPVVLGLLLRRALKLGARLAEPGEFTQRAFLAGKIDLTQAEAVRDLIEAHPMFKRMRLIEGSSISAGVIDQVKQIASTRKKVMVCLDSNHTHAHVLQELSLYAPLTSKGSYCVVFDTVVEDMPSDYEWNRPWGKGNNPKTAVWEFLKSHPEFEVDSSIHNKLLITVAPDGYLKRVK